MFGAVEALLQHGTDPGGVAANHRGRVEPEAGEDLALENAVAVGDEAPVAPAVQGEPVDRLVVDAPDDVLADAVAAVGFELVVQVVAGAAGGDLAGQLRGPFDVAVVTGP